MENISEINDSLEHIDTMIGDEIDLAEVDSVIEQIVGTRNLKIAQDSQHDQTLETKLGQLALNEKKESENGMAGKDPGEQEIDLVIKEVLEGSNGDDSSEKQETHADVIVESESQILRSEEHSKKHSHDNEVILTNLAIEIFPHNLNASTKYICFSYFGLCLFFFSLGYVMGRVCGHFFIGDLGFIYFRKIYFFLLFIRMTLCKYGRITRSTSSF